MVDRDKQQWADALAALHAGHHDEEPEQHHEHEPDAEAPEAAEGAQEPGEARQDRARHASAPPPAPSPQPKRSRRPSTPIEALQNASPPPASTMPATSAPDLPPSPGPSPREQDLAPEGSPGVPENFMATTTAAARPHPRPMPAPRAPTALVQTIGYRRTLIPILLTSALILWVFAAWMLIRSGSAVLGEISTIYPAVMVLGGFVLLILAVLNMVQVRRQLEPDDATPSEE